MADNVEAGRCSTCRWSEDATRGDYLVRPHGLTLRCTRVHDRADSLAAVDINPEWGMGRALVVSPDFGCVMYETRIIEGGLRVGKTHRYEGEQLRELGLEPREPTEPVTLRVTDVSPDTITVRSRVGTREFVGYATVDCPNCGAIVRTEDAELTEQIPRGLRFRDVPCHQCGKFYTLEITEKPEASNG